RLKDWLAGFHLRPLPIPLAVALILLALVLGGWWIRRQQEIQNDPPVAKTGTDQGRPLPAPSPSPSLPDLAPQLSRGKQKPKQSKPRTPRQMNLAPRVETRKESNESQVAVTQYEQPLTVTSVINPETTKHFEQAQLLLRSFRNADEAE